MGRTKRRRLRKNHAQFSENFSNDSTVINLYKWLTQNNWNNDQNLKLRNFPETGRGVTSTKTVQANDILISIPYDLMITFTTLQTNLQEIISTSRIKLKIHDLLTLFLVIEKHKEKSLWRAYINSLPTDPPVLPWLGTSEELKLYPVDLQIISIRTRENFEESMYRLGKSIKKHSDCVLDQNLFKWGYVLVNTRAVYVDPRLVCNMSNDVLKSILADEPSMALCPFLDMLNHHFVAKTEARFVYKEGKPVYQLKTLTKYNKYSQIFISYGAHSNEKLLMEYGFFVSGNIFDTANFSLQEVLNIIKTTVDQRQYKFIKDHGFDKYEELYIGYSGVSFKLKALLFVSFGEHARDFNSVIYSDSYSEDYLKSLFEWTKELLDYKLSVFESDYMKLKDCGFMKSENALLMESFLYYRIQFVSDLKNKLNV